MPGTALVLGARNLGGAILDHLVLEGWRAAGVARSADTLDAVRARGALAIEADASDPEAVRSAIALVREELGAPTLFVNAVSASRPPRADGPFGGGPVAEASLEELRGWAGAVTEQALVFLGEAARSLLADGAEGTIVQITGGSARRAMPGRGLWAAGAQGVRALTHAAAQELRALHIHVALLIVDATIESPKTAASTRDAPPDATADQRLVAEAVGFLAMQRPRAYTHELVLTPAGDRWVP
jgi:NADP-dependent 3-hydroxy acid dehydrogenase YdfG